MIEIDTTEELIQDSEALPEPLRNWRLYRIEYGGCNEDCLWEGRLLLPANSDPDIICELIKVLQEDYE